MDVKNDLILENVALESLNHSLSILVNSLYESSSKPKYYQTDLESKFQRFFLTNLSILKLVEGLRFEISGKTLLTRDIFSIYNLSRMQIESFIVINYLYFDDISDYEKEFRYDLYQLQGLTKQSSFNVAKLENQKKKDLILKEVKIIKTKIQESSIFKNADIKTKKEYLSAKYALLNKKEDLFERYGLSKLRFNEVWSLYSNHSHSEHIGDRQFNSYYKVEKSTDKAMISPLMNNSVLTAKLCNFLLKHFECTIEKFNGLPLSDKILIKKYDF